MSARSVKLCAVASLLGGLVFSSLSAQTYVLLETGANGKTSVAGDKALLGGSYPPASTFKLLIARAALQENLAEPETLHFCQDQGGKEVTMAQAMFASSNDYFRWLGSRLDPKKLDEIVQKSGWGGKLFPAGIWRKSGLDGIERGGELRVTVEQVHTLTVGWMNESPSPLTAELKKVMRRPWNNSQSRIFGKTGAWGGAVWMTGYYDAEDPAKRVAVTVFAPYAVPQWKPAREVAMKEFYRAFGQPNLESK